MSKPKFTVIKGGLSDSINTKAKHFISAYITDTRLMGVLAIYAQWRIVDTYSEQNLHQFFYIDCEEMGWETYKSVLGNDMEEIDQIEQALVGGLGAKKIAITQKQLQGILTYYGEFNRHNDLPLPENYPEYRFLLEPETILEHGEKQQLMQKICGEVVSDYQLINYFLMRAFGHDHNGAAYLADENCPLDLYGNYRQATFCKNVIDQNHAYSDGAVSYLCESLIEMDGNYETVVSEVIVKNLKVIAFRHCSGFAVSTAEAAMILVKTEFVTVYEVLLSDEDMDRNIGELTVNLNTVMSTHENGRLFMAFKQNNDHVNSRIFRLSNDVKGIYFLTNYGQLIVASYSLRDIRLLENKLKSSPLAPYLVTTAKYEFKDPVLFEFIQSDFDDFNAFLEFIME